MKYRILQKLMENAPGYVSGEDLSAVFNVSRTAIWKYIKQLKKEGYNIDSSTKKGYRLISSPDILNGHEISYGLDTCFIGKKVIYFEETDSTNNQAKRIASEGGENGVVVVADRQTAGRGRLGRKWVSSGGKGIWMSVILRPPLAPQDVQLVTLAASVAVVRAISKATGISTGIKWPNDIILDGKKVCGILTEMSSEMDQVNYVVVGIGLNVNHSAEDFPEELHNLAISLKAYAKERQMNEVGFRRAELARSLLKELERLYVCLCNGNTNEIIEEWKKHSVTLGREVVFLSRGSEYTGTAVDITADGKLIVECSDGIRREVLSGEVTIRGLAGYV